MLIIFGVALKYMCVTAPILFECIRGNMSSLVMQSFP
jgi:hypothetical protein